MQDMTTEQMAQYIEKAYSTLPEDDRRKLETYADALRKSQLTHDRTEK